MLLIWTVYRVWGIRSYEREQGGRGKRTEVIPQRTSAPPFLQHQTLSFWEVPTRSLVLWVPSCLP